MNKFYSIKEILDNTKIITPSDYLYVILPNIGSRDGVKGKVLKPTKAQSFNINWSLYEPKNFPPFKGKEDPNWEKFYLIEEKGRRLYRYSKDNFSIASQIRELITAYEAYGYKPAERILGKKIMEPFKDVWDTL